MAAWFATQMLTWLLDAILNTLKELWGLLSRAAFTTPDVTRLPQVAAITSRSLAIVNVCFILAIITAGIVVMTRETVQVRYGLGELAPRLVLGFVAANFSVPICQHLIEAANALTQALTGEGIASQRAFAQLLRLLTDAFINPANAFLLVIIGLIIAVLTGMLLVTWLVRLGVLIVLIGVAPIALACHALPYTDGAARLWWRALLGCLGTVVLQALALHTALSIFLDPHANVAPLGIPPGRSGTFNLFVVGCLLWVTVKIPGLMRRYVTRGGGGHNVAGMIVRMVLVQQLTSMLRLPLRRGGGRAAAGGALRGGGGPRGGGPGGGGNRLPQTLGGGSPGPAGRRALPPARGAGRGRVGVAWPTGRPVWPYTPQEVASGVDPYTRTVAKRPAPPATQPPSTRPPVRAGGAQPAPPASRARPVIPAGVNPATAMPKTRPVSRPVRSPWNTPTRRR